MHKFLFNNVLYRYIRGKCEDKHGYCKDPKSEDKDRIIAVNKSLKGKKELEINIHEMLHACSWDFADEEWVKRTAKDIGEALWKLGYRNNEKTGEQRAI